MGGKPLVRSAASALVAVTLAVAGTAAVPEVASAAPWTVSALSDGTTVEQLASTLVGPGITVKRHRHRARRSGSSHRVSGWGATTVDVFTYSSSHVVVNVVGYLA